MHKIKMCLLSTQHVVVDSEKYVITSMAYSKKSHIV